MATYYDKKKLIEDNSDVYISDYDKNLDYSYLSDIIDQKRAYSKAQSVGDTKGMKNANDWANSIRLHAAGYTSGDDGSKFIRGKMPYEDNAPKKTDSKYKKEMDNLYKSISMYENFNYDVYKDPLYQTYKDIYLSLGDDAYNRALGENSMRTGGVTNTSAISAASLARNKYNTMLANIVPELYEKAYTKHRDGLEDLYNMLDVAEGFEEKEYERYRDSVDDYINDRDYFYKKDRDRAQDLYKGYTDETNLAYDMSRDAVSDKQDDDKLSFEKEKYAGELQSQKEENHIKKLSVAVNLAKALYGKVPVSRNAINTIMSMLD